MKKLMSKLMVGAVILSVLAPSASYAASTASTQTQVQGVEQHQMKQMTQEEREANQAKLMEIIKKYTPELADQFQTLFDQQEKVRAQVDAIRKQVKAGTLTEEEAQAKLKELGVDFGGRGFGGHDKDGQQLDDATKAKVDAIRDQVKAGTLTEEEAQAQLKALGVDFGPGQHQDPIQQILDAAAQNDEAKVKELLTQLLTHLQEQNK